MEGLKHCPFCSSKNIQYVATYKEIPLLPSWGFMVICPTTEGGCGASSILANSSGEAIEAWNKRAY